MPSAIDLTRKCHPDSSGAPRSVLVIASSPVMSDQLLSHLEHGGLAHVESRNESSEGIDACRTMKPNLAVIDIELRVNDRTVAEIVANDLNTPVIVIGPPDTPELAAAANSAGALAYLVTPVAGDQLLVSLQIAWGRHLDRLAAREEIEKLERRLEERKIIEQAKWVLVQRMSISEPEAMRLLQRHARNKRRPLAAIASSIVEMEDIFDFKALAS